MSANFAVLNRTDSVPDEIHKLKRDAILVSFGLARDGELEGTL